jgi:hypothetical protein
MISSSKNIHLRMTVKLSNLFYLRLSPVHEVTRTGTDINKQDKNLGHVAV